MKAQANLSRPRQRPQRPLSRDVILDGAITMIEREGSGALTMRRLGSSLGVEAMAIYHYFAGRDELVDAIGDRLLEPLGEVELGTDWHAACRRFASALRDLAVAQPSTFQLVGLAPLDSPVALRPVERLLGVLVADGFGPGEALAVYRALVSYARGYALAEVTGFTVDAARDAGRQRLASLPAGEFPILAGRIPELSRIGADAAFELGLEALLTGLADPSRATACRR